MAHSNRRQFIKSSVTAGLAFGFTSSSLARRCWPASKNDWIHLGMISCGDRAMGLANTFSKLEGVRIAGVCDPDSSRVARMRETFPSATAYSDLRELLASKEIDAVVIATTNHWHCLASIWAMEAGKDVYVEKPLSHSQWEGRQAVATAHQLGRVCQVGTQQRSDPMQAQIKQFLHDSQELGPIMSVRVNRFGVRDSIGRLEQPLQIQQDLAFDHWLGPAQNLPILRPKLHYDWHWDWNTGSGEMGNWGVHLLDDVRNVVFRDEVSLPRGILSGGGRVVWNDAGQTPNVHLVFFDTGTIPVVFGLTNLAAQAGEKTSPQPQGPMSGYVVYCEGGRLEGQRGSAVAFDKNGQELKRFSGTGGEQEHLQNFLDAVRAQNRRLLNCEVQIGNDSTGWCNLANIAHRVAGLIGSNSQAHEIRHSVWQDLLRQMNQQLQAHKLNLKTDPFTFSELLLHDPAEATFVGETLSAKLANKFLKREYRAGYVVPERAIDH